MKSTAQMGIFDCLEGEGWSGVKELHGEWNEAEQQQEKGSARWKKSKYVQLSAINSQDQKMDL